MTIAEKDGTNSRCPGFFSLAAPRDTIWRAASGVRSPQRPPGELWRRVVHGQSTLNWGSAPRQLPPLGRFAPLVGELGELDGEGYLLAFRARLPAGYRLPPHEPTGYVAVSVMGGNLRLGYGTSGDAASMVDLPVGSHALLGGAISLLAASEDTLVQFDVLTPFRLYYENTSDDPVLRATPWLARLIAERKSSSPPIASVRRFEYQARRLYLLTLACNDCYENVYEEDGTELCAPGGVHGRGNGSCPDLRGALAQGTTIWQARTRH